MFACGVSTGELLLWDVRAEGMLHELQVRSLYLCIPAVEERFVACAGGDVDGRVR